ncbi:anti-lipopolysaccharide factor [Penaeus vannamei]|uniref:Antilipopolysaccharide factor isoform 4 n=1 Tax=Penaeus vannamei TaxID=6689 RepID=A0A3R7PAE9_PENVA|nr:antilipopolysaccharide factor isoform 4 [Penaeus vannamei]
MRVLVSSVVALALIALVPRSQGQGVQDLIPSLVQRIVGLWHSDEVEFMGHSCRYSQRPSFYRWELYFNGRMWCPGWAPFTGRSRTRSPSGAVEHATRDFVQKALQSNLITEDDARIWLEH